MVCADTVSSASLTDEWCTLLDQCSAAYPFQHPAWHTVWWQVFGPENGCQPLSLAVRDGDRLRALAPLMRRGDDLWLAGDPEICDYMDLVVPAGADDALYERLVEAIAAEPWRRLVLWGLPEESATLAQLPRLAVARGWTVEQEFEEVCPRIAPLPPTWDGYLETLSKKDRHELRRKLRRFSEAGANMTFYAVSTPAEVRAGMDDFLRLLTISRRDKADFMTERMEQFFRAMTERLAGEGLLKLYFVELDGKRVAGLVTFDTGAELLLYNSGYDPAYAFASVGLVSKALTLQAAIADGKGCYDFLRGAEPYKYDLGARDRTVYRLTLTRV